jgi:uncharacterized protein (TIGR00297 family)
VSEILRKGAHAGVGFFALLFAVLPPAACLGLAILSLIHNAFFLPRYAPWLWREKDHRMGYSPGVIAYSVTLVLLCVVYWNRPDIAASGWGVLAFGDGIASLVGRAFGRSPLPWNRKKSWAGLAAFAIAASASCFLLAGFVRMHVEMVASLPHANLLLASVIAGVTGAVVESLDQPLDDNIAAPLAAAAAFALIDSFDPSSWLASMPGVEARAIRFFVFSAVLGALAWRAKTMTASGFFSGVVLSSITGAFGGPAMFAALTAFWMTAEGATRVGWTQKASQGIAQSTGGRRRARHAFSKLGIPALLTIFERITPTPRPFELAAFSALAAAACDTVATEIGKLSKENPRQIPFRKPVPPGTPGGMTLLGWGAGIAAAAIVVLAAWLAGASLALPEVALILIAAILAGFVESAIGGFLIPRGLIGKSALNFVLSATAAWIAWLLAGHRRGA